MAAEAHGDEAELVDQPLDMAERLAVGLERHVLRPAAHRRQFDIFEARRRDARQRLFDAVRMIAVGMPAEPVLVCHFNPSSSPLSVGFDPGAEASAGPAGCR